LRDPNSTTLIQAHSLRINSLDFNYFHRFLFLSGSEDKTVALWDLRNLSVKLHSFNYHKEPVTNVRWSPFHENHFVSAGNELCLWDTNNIGSPISFVEAEEGPKELIVIFHIYIF
jgi:histone-binding protein RBBP4